MNAIADIRLDLSSYDAIIVALSGGKDSIACLCLLLDAGVDPDRIELWHHDVDGHGGSFMDWPSTLPYVQALAAAFSVPLYCSWRNGGFEAEMLREDRPTAPVWFDTPYGMRSAGGQGRPGTRLRFPQVSADLSVRWCSSVLKIDVADVAIRGQDRFLGQRTLVVTGERAEESPSRARYAVLEPHRSDTRTGSRRRRYVDHWRPVHAFPEAQVWDLIARHRITPGAAVSARVRAHVLHELHLRLGGPVREHPPHGAGLVRAPDGLREAVRLHHQAQHVARGAGRSRSGLPPGVGAAGPGPRCPERRLACPDPLHGLAAPSRSLWGESRADLRWRKRGRGERNETS